MLTLGGFPLLVPDANLIAWSRADIDPALACPWVAERGWPGPSAQRLPFPNGLRMPRVVRPGSLYWPRGASRWAYGHFFAAMSDVRIVRDLAFGSDGRGEPAALELVMDDGLGLEQVVTPMYLLPPVPLGGVDPVDDVEIEGLYLLTVVDVRWYWQWKPTPEYEVDETTTWDDMITLTASALKVAVPHEAVAGAYLTPPALMDLPYESAAIMMDAVAACVGQRFYRKLNGDCEMHGPDAAIAARQFADGSVVAEARRRLAGGAKFSDLL